MAELVEGDPCRVLLSHGCIARRYVEQSRSDPYKAVWWPEDDEDHAFILRWLAGNAPGFLTEVEVEVEDAVADPPDEDADGQSIGVPCKEFIRFPSPELAVAFVAWLTGTQRAWEARNALVAADCPAFCFACGGPMESTKIVTEVDRVVDIEIAFTAPRFWCDHCDSGAHAAIRGTALQVHKRRAHVHRIVRNHLGLRKGQRAVASAGPARVRIDVDMETPDAAIQASLVA